MTDEELEKILNSYIEELSDLEKRRKEESERLSTLTEDELVEELTKEYSDVVEHAKENGVTIGVVQSNQDKNKK